MNNAKAAREEAARLLAAFEARGAQRVETDILQPADILLDLYGEDIRARAFVTHDPARGEVMLRPDFTVPVLRAHLESAAADSEARYTYAGKVFRAQEEDSQRAPEYYQVGYEIIGAADPAKAEAEVFAAMAEELAPLGLRAATGDIGLILAAIEGLETSPRRKAALKRHVWRPGRFRALLERFAGRRPPPKGRADLLALEDPLAGIGPVVGLRSRAEIAERVELLRADAQQAPIPAHQVALLEDILALRETTPNVLAQLRDMAVDMPTILPKIERMEARCEALSALGMAPEGLAFEGAYGRTALEYYDGFVFGFSAVGKPGLPAIATGGRYDALAEVLGQGRAVPAVGGVIRPELVRTAKEGA